MRQKSCERKTLRLKILNSYLHSKPSTQCGREALHMSAMRAAPLKVFPSVQRVKLAAL